MSYSNLAGLGEADHPNVDIPLVTVIEPVQGWVPLKLKDLWACRDLLYFLVWRDIKVRYRQTLLGAGWAIIQPLMTMIIFSVIFGHFARMPSDGMPYAIFSYTGLLPWNLFSSALTRSTHSVVGNANLIKKVYFPRLIIPLASTLPALVDFAMAFLVLIGLMFYYKVMPGLVVLMLPLFILLALVTALAVGLWLSALNARYRDVGQAVPFVVQAWMYASPVAYAISLVPEKWRLVYALNPMVGVIEGFRWSLLGTGEGLGPMLAVSCGVTLLVLISGALYFRRLERVFADVM